MWGGSPMMTFVLLRQQDEEMFQGRQRAVDLDLLGSVYDSLDRLPVLSRPQHSQTVCQDRGIEGQQQLCVQVLLPGDMQEVYLALSLLHQGPDVEGPGVVSRDVGAQKLEGGDSFHPFSIYEKVVVVQSVLLEVHYEIFCLMDVQSQVVLGAPERKLLFLGLGISSGML